MRLRAVINVVVLMTVLVSKCGAETLKLSQDERNSARNFFERTMLELMSQRGEFVDGFTNATVLLQRKYDTMEGRGSAVEARGKRKRLKQMNQTLIAIVMAYTLKFLFLIPTFIGTLILFKFTAALAGFFYALFAAALGLDHHRYEH